MQNTELDQHFLIDKNILKKIVDTAKIKKEDKIIEIGCGSGILTKEICLKPKEFIGFEVDERYKEELRKYEAKKSKIIFDSALNHSWVGYNKIISNLPYGLSEPVIYKAIEDKVEDLTLTIGKSFKELLVENKNKISIITNLYYDITPIKEIPKKAFSPPPRVKSYLIKLESKKPNKIEKILKFVIERKGKTKNAIMYALVLEGITKRQARELIEKMNLDSKILENSTKRITGNFLLELKEKLKEKLS